MLYAAANRQTEQTRRPTRAPSNTSPQASICIATRHAISFSLSLYIYVYV